jgi:hypothetical protein
MVMRTSPNFPRVTPRTTLKWGGEGRGGGKGWREGSDRGRDSKKERGEDGKERGRKLNEHGKRGKDGCSGNSLSTAQALYPLLSIELRISQS